MVNRAGQINKVEGYLISRTRTFYFFFAHSDQISRAHMTNLMCLRHTIYNLNLKSLYNGKAILFVFVSMSLRVSVSVF